MWSRSAFAVPRLAASALLMACSTSSPVDLPDAQAPDADAALPSDADSGNTASGTLPVAQCSGLPGGTETCAFRYQYDSARCTAQTPCTKLVAFFAGGEQNCATASYGDVLRAYADAGYVAACLQIFETSSGSGAIPYAEEAPRVDAVLRAVLDFAKPVWSGEHLLLSGISHGATAPVTAMARTALDDAWKGTKTTGACFYDGIYDLRAIDDLLGTGNGGGPCMFPVSHARIVGRYYPADPLLHSCMNAKCACAQGHAPAMDTDSITAVPPAEFAIKHWKLVECGSGTPTCAGDIVPKEPIEALCASLRTGAAMGYDCTDDAMPMDTHLVCHRTGIARCLAWFDALAK